MTDLDEWSLTEPDADGDVRDPNGDNRAGGDNDDDAPTLYYSNVEAFVRDHLALTYRRALDGRNRAWCPQWWRHPEAIIRLETLWRAWEHLSLDPATGMSAWLRDHADHHMSVLLDPDGPFKGCSPDKGHGARLAPLPLDDPPRGPIRVAATRSPSASA